MGQQAFALAGPSLNMYAGQDMLSPEQQLVQLGEYRKHAKDLAKSFIQRWDIHARQIEDGRYICIHKPLRNKHLISHLRGKITLGAYLLDPVSYSRFIIFDADDDRSYAHLIDVARSLESNQLKPYLETSRRGGHLWLFFSQPVPGLHAREFGKGIIAAHNLRDVEMFPKQDLLTGGPGSLIRLPFGFHQLSGRRYPFITPEGERIATNAREQIKILSSPETVPDGVFEAYRSHVVDPQPKPNKLPQIDFSPMLSDQIKKRVSVLEFVNRYVELQPTNQGALGLCPFHDDHNPSFSVNVAENYWQCFAGCGGGSIIDFWMKWQECDFVTAISELANVVLYNNLDN